MPFLFLKTYFKVLTTTKRTRDLIEKIYRGPRKFRQNDTQAGIFFGFYGIFGISHFSGGAFYRRGYINMFVNNSQRDLFDGEIKNRFLWDNKICFFLTFFNYNVNH